MEKKEQRFWTKHLWMKDWGAKRIHQDLVTTLSDNAYGVSQIKIWLKASKEMLRILQGSDRNQFEGITTHDVSRFRYSYQSSKTPARSPADVILRTRQAIGAKKTMVTLFFAARKLSVLDVMPKRCKYNQ
jgi:hypothetical protein